MDYDAIFDESLKIGLDGEELLRLIAEAYVARGERAVEVKNDRRYQRLAAMCEVKI